MGSLNGIRFRLLGHFCLAYKDIQNGVWCLDSELFWCRGVGGHVRSIVSNPYSSGVSIGGDVGVLDLLSKC